MTHARLPIMIGCLSVVLLSACGDPQGSGEALFDPVDWFVGDHVSRGQTTTLTLSNTAFTATFEGVSTGPNAVRLNELFDFPDGDYLQIWDLTSEGTAISGTVKTERKDGDFSPSVPVRGTLSGSAATLVYDGYAPGGEGTRFTFTHRMVLQEDETVRNRVIVRYGPFPVAWSSVRFAADREALTSVGEGLKPSKRLAARAEPR